MFKRSDSKLPLICLTEIEFSYLQGYPSNSKKKNQFHLIDTHKTNPVHCLFKNPICFLSAQSNILIKLNYSQLDNFLCVSDKERTENPRENDPFLLPRFFPTPDNRITNFLIISTLMKLSNKNEFV